MSVDVFINFEGNCREAVEFYAEVFGCEKPEFMTFGQGGGEENSEFPISEEMKDLILYTSLNISGSNVMFSDVYPGLEIPFVKGNNINITVGSENKEDIKKWYNKLSDGGIIGMELQETFWSECYGSVIDKFGVPWQFSYTCKME